MTRQTEQLENDFKLALPQRIYELESACDVLLSEGGTLDSLSLLHGKVGNLIAVSSVAGAVQLSMAARTLERLLDEALLAPASFDDAHKELFSQHLKRFIELAREWQFDAQGDELNDQGFVEEKTTLYILDKESLLANEIETLSYYGYKLEQFETVDQLFDRSNSAPPSAVLMNVAFADTCFASEEQEKLNRLTPPLIIISKQCDIQSRLAAVRLGAVRFFAKPLDMGKLKATLDGMTARVPIKPYRVLIVEDDPEISLLYSEALSSANIQVECLADPLGIFGLLVEFQPELVLMDIMTLGCDAIELAAVIRQDDSYNQIPIVFLSEDNDLSQRLVAMNLGGDEFISKNADADYLRSVVLARVKRKRWVERLNQELHTSMRESEYLRVAMNHHIILSITDVTGKIIFVNDKFCDVSGYQADELIGKNHRVIKSGMHTPEFYQYMWDTISGGMVWQGEVCNHRKGGGHYWVESTIVPFLDEKGKPYQYISVRTDISHIKEAEEALIKARDLAEKASQAKTEFISHMSHELRTPLNAILGYAQLFEYDQTMNERQHKSAQEIYRAGEHLLALVNEVLDLSRIEAGCLELSLESVSLFDLTSECRELMRPQLQSKSIELEIDHCNFVVKGDATRLKQVLLNLLSNSVKYNDQGGKVCIRCMRSDEGSIRLSVIDNGYGIAKELQCELFQPFNRLGAERGEIEGAGVGLTLSKQLIEMMGGIIGFDSTLGEGSVFWFEMPLVEIPAIAAPPLLVGDDVEVDDSKVEASKVICYVEDNPANLRLMERIVHQRSYIKLIHAVSAEEGVPLIKEAQPDLVLMDINLPGMDGYEALRHLRADSATRDIPAIAVTANAMPKDIEQGEREGFAAYLTKPLNIKLFLESLDRLFNVDGKV